MSSMAANPWVALEKFAPGGKGKLQMSAWTVPSLDEQPPLPPTWFKEDMDDLACVICLEVPLQPAYCPHCSQLSCMGCAKQWFSSPTGHQCPMCRREVSLSALNTQFSREERVEMEGRTATCPLCDWEGTAFEVGDHLLHSCPLRPTPCPNKGCKSVLRHKDIESHVAGSCAETRMTCPHCRKPFKGERGRVHIRSCPKEVVKCPREVNPAGPTGRHPGRPGPNQKGGRSHATGGQRGKGRVQGRARPPAPPPAPPAAAAPPPPAAGPGQKGGAGDKGKGGLHLALPPVGLPTAARVPLALACLFLLVASMAHLAPSLAP